MDKVLVTKVVDIAIKAINYSAGIAAVIVAKKGMKIFVEPAVRESITHGVEEAFKICKSIKSIGKIKNIV